MAKKRLTISIDDSGAVYQFLSTLSNQERGAIVSRFLETAYAVYTQATPLLPAVSSAEATPAASHHAPSVTPVMATEPSPVEAPTPVADEVSESQIDDEALENNIDDEWDPLKRMQAKLNKDNNGE